MANRLGWLHLFYRSKTSALRRTYSFTKLMFPACVHTRGWFTVWLRAAEQRAVVVIVAARLLLFVCVCGCRSMLFHHDVCASVRSRSHRNRRRHTEKTTFSEHTL